MLLCLFGGLFTLVICCLLWFAVVGFWLAFGMLGYLVFDALLYTVVFWSLVGLDDLYVLLSCAVACGV